MKNDYRVESWAELYSALYDIPETEHQRYRSDYVYRGVDDASWDLKTSLQRLGSHAIDVERPLLRNFQKYAGPGEIYGQDLFLRLAIAQHHGLPTRVLDWTTSPKVAVHFATSDEKLYGSDGAIWCIDVAAARDFLPRKLRGILAEARAYLFSVEMLSEFKRLDQLDALPEAEFVVFFEPPSLDARIVNQGAVLSIMRGAASDLKAFLEQPAYEGLYKRIIIPKALKWELRDKLDQDNVTERMLFPGLDGTARWLKRYYGLGPRTPA